MEKSARDRANDRYRKKNVKSFNVKFFPADKDVYEWFSSRDGKNRYIKDLIKADMEGRQR